jgi:hypothetical protein
MIEDTTNKHERKQARRTDLAERQQSRETRRGLQQTREEFHCGACVRACTCVCGGVCVCVRWVLGSDVRATNDNSYPWRYQTSLAISTALATTTRCMHSLCHDSRVRYCTRDQPGQIQVPSHPLNTHHRSFHISIVKQQPQNDFEDTYTTNSAWARSTRLESMCV